MTTTTTPTDDLLSPVQPKLPTPGKKIGLQDIFGFQEPYIKRKAEIQKGIAQASEEEAKGKQEQAEILSTGKKEAQDVYEAAEKQAMDRYKERTEAEPIPAFVPTKDNAQDLASLFSVINVIGMLVGGGGRTNAVNALAAMDGMAKGYQQGRTDLYRQERDTFEKNYRAMLQKHAEFRKEMEDAIKLAATNKEAGLAAAELAATKAGSSIIKAQIRKGDLVGAYKNVDESQKGAEKALDFIEKEQTRAATEAAAERRHRETLAAAAKREAARMTHQEKMAELKAVGKPASATNERYANTVFRASNEVLRNLELVEKIGITTGGGALGGVVGKGTIPSELQRNLGQYFTEEQQRNYNTAMSGIALELAYVLNGGYKPTEGQISKLDTLLSVGPNDTYGNAAYKFADVTAKLKAAIETSPAYTEDQRKTKEMLNEKMSKYATPEEVQSRIYGTPKTEEPVVRSGEVSRPQTKSDFDAIPPGGLYIDPDDGKTYRKRK